MASVLCIEDETHLREDIAEELRDSGYTTYEARDGVEGLQMILRHKPDMVVSDISMPRMNGRELVQTLREEHPEFADMPVVFLTAFNDRKDMLEGLRIGADDYLTKPVNYELLQTKVACALRQSGRMIDRKREQNVQLYKALTSNKPEPAPEPEPKPIKYRVTLVGESSSELWAIHRQLEDLQTKVRIFTSGRSFVEKGLDDTIDAVLIWPKTDDYDATTIAQAVPEGSMTIVAVSPEGSKPRKLSNVFHEPLAMPLDEGGLAGRLDAWQGEKIAD